MQELGLGSSRYALGMMQGRLSPPEEGRFQSFPRESWREEFARAKAAGLEYIEWIHDEYGRTANPIFTAAGLAEFDALKQEHGIATPALCGDWFMDFPLIRCTAEEQAEREAHLHALIPVAARIGAKKMVLPFVDQSSMKTDAEKETVRAVLRRALPVAEAHGVELHLEADFGPEEFAAFLREIEHRMLKVNWDSGNSSGLGYMATEEFAAYGERVGSVHIKDRYRKPEGGVETRPLGTGSADFEDVFRAIRSIGYRGGLTLQVARGSAGDEVEFIKGQIEFLRSYCSGQE
ncbi:MAG: sugar phosphate isomerase/epimerase [Acidobacteria bacterium]|nr:sugar phosphate isomerase/epimerase [Acidobacteriota bacterium]